MAIEEVFEYPTVKQVIFQIRFPNLFSIENRIGEFQLEIMKEFPESNIVHRQNQVIARLGTDGKIITPRPEFFNVEKIWQFKSPNNYELNVDSKSLSINSEYHKTYNNRSQASRFRDVIEGTVTAFLELTRVPIINRIGLRYIDSCPIREKTTASFTDCYNAKFPLERFTIENNEELVFRAIGAKGEYFLNYLEHFKKEGDEYRLILDTDAFAKDIKPPDRVLPVTDELHLIISEEYENTIKEPVYQYMHNGAWNA